MDVSLEEITAYKRELENIAATFMEYYNDELLDVIEGHIDIDLLRKDKTKENEEQIFKAGVCEDWDLDFKVYDWLDIAWFKLLDAEFLKNCETDLDKYRKLLALVKNVEKDERLWRSCEFEQEVRLKAFYSVKNDLYKIIEAKIRKFIIEIVAEASKEVFAWCSNCGERTVHIKESSNKLKCKICGYQRNVEKQNN